MLKLSLCLLCDEELEGAGEGLDFGVVLRVPLLCLFEGGGALLPPPPPAGPSAVHPGEPDPVPVTPPLPAPPPDDDERAFRFLRLLPSSSFTLPKSASSEEDLSNAAKVSES